MTASQSPWSPPPSPQYSCLTPADRTPPSPVQQDSPIYMASSTTEFGLQVLFERQLELPSQQSSDSPLQLHGLDSQIAYCVLHPGVTSALVPETQSSIAELRKRFFGTV